jgi:hypothetical protein
MSDVKFNDVEVFNEVEVGTLDNIYASFLSRL